MKLKDNIRNSAITFLLAFVALTVLSVPAFAQEAKTDVSSTGQTGQSTAARVTIMRDFEIDAESAEMADLTSTSSATFGSLNLTVQVDQTYCSTGGVQCTGPGLSTIAAANTNRNPVRFGLQVLQGTTPVNTLTDIDINVVNSFVPAGGTAVVKTSCANCFQNAGNGMYAIFVNPFGVANWKSGSYFVQVQVKVGARTHRALAQIEIPF